MKTTDTLGLVLTVLVTAAAVHDSAGGKQALTELAAAHPSVTKVWADGGYQTSGIQHGVRLGIDVEVVQRPRVKGFQPLPKRWVIERTFGRLMQHRRLARDCEALPPQIPSSKVRIPAVADAILSAMRGDGRSVEEMRQRINARWANHGFADKTAAGRLESPVSAVIAMVRPLRRGDRYACADTRCEDGRNLDSGEACRLCEVRAADRKAAQQRKRAAAGAQKDRRPVACHARPSGPQELPRGRSWRTAPGPHCTRSIPTGTGPLCGDCLEQQEAEAAGVALAEQWAVEKVYAAEQAAGARLVAELEREDAGWIACEETEVVEQAEAEAERRRLTAEEDARLRAEFARQNPGLAALSSQGPAQF
ncbi:transposase [Streptomyces vietnamensis]